MGKGFAEGSPGIGAGFSSRYGARCVLPRADSAQSPGQAGPCSACPAAGHTHKDAFTSRYNSALNSSAFSASAPGPAEGRDRGRGLAAGRCRGGVRPRDWLRGPAGGGAAPFPVRPVRAPWGRGNSARPWPERGARCSLCVPDVPMCSQHLRARCGPPASPLTFHLPGIPRGIHREAPVVKRATADRHR